MAYKIARLEKIIEREIGTILLNSKDERLRFVTVTKVSLTSDASIATVYYTVLGNKEQIEAYKKQPRLLDYFVGQMMKKTRGKANPAIASKLLKDELERR